MTVGPRRWAVRPSPGVRCGAHDVGMTNQRRELFEQLWLYRQVYRLRGRYDSEPVLSVAGAIALGEHLMGRRRSQILPAGVGST